ncbi:Protein CBG22848 [Caenorhabditis briggsae]|uniref:Protein CBG22848 n=1 Tax=Caenorhabditis briggsae TaxID=6238 RepID=A8Y372_CAEBR|nr:Protein CBG22848 [Caenorhabditis briggsae]CAP39341.1 Protein CBG22848 [Caenorhabditis briggsae]
MSSLCKMPDLVKEEIVKFCGFREVLTLRQVCQDFKNFIDDLKASKLPDSKFENVQIIVKDENHIRLTLFPYAFIDYFRKEKTRKFGKKTTIFEDQDIMDIVIFDLEQVLKFQKSSKKLQISAFKQAQVMSILPLLNPKVLEEINIENPEISQHEGHDSLGMEQIMETEQWKNAKKLNCDYFALGGNVKKIAHFSIARISFTSVSVRNLDILRKALLNFSLFEISNISIKFLLEHHQLSILWGAPYFSGFFIGWFFKMSNGDVMKIDYEPGFFRNPANFEFSKIKIEDVPVDANVQELPMENC